MEVMGGPALRALAEKLAPSRKRIEHRDKALLADQVAIAEIPAPTGHEQRRATWVRDRLRERGLDDVRIDDAGNVLGVTHGHHDAAPAVVCAHLDTVFEPGVQIEVQRGGRRLSAPGICDNARGLAAMLSLAREFGSGQLRPLRPVVFAATTGEEGAGDLRGSRHLFDTAGSSAYAAIALDGAGDERIVSCAIGARRLRVEFRGAGGHSWSAWGAPNAVHAAAAAVARLTALDLPAHPRTTLTVARINGGTAINAIPSDCWIEVDIRSSAPAELTRLEHLLHRCVQESIDQENAYRPAGVVSLSASVFTLGDRPAGEMAAADPLVSIAAEATRMLGLTPELSAASTDANIPMSRGIPAVAIGGGGRGGDTHTSREWFENVNGSRGVIRALLVIAAMSGIR
jgi:acetylornithine deacetylase/succinyl-diaminopimelate desuccinylase-like protein